MRVRAKEGQVYPYEYQLKNIWLISTLMDKRTELTSVVGEMSIFENIFTNTMTGYIYVQEQLNLISNFPIVGHEKIEIAMLYPQIPDKEINHTFRIYSINNIARPTHSSRSYMINFVSEEYTTNLKTSISRSFSQQTVSSIVKSICNTDLDISNLDAEKTGNVHDILIPNWKPFDAINWLSKRAISEQFEGANYMFFQTREGYSFKSLEFLMSKKSQLKYNQTIVSEETNKQVEDDTRNTITEIQLESTFDLLKNIPSGMYANRLLIHDMIKRETETLDYNYAEKFSDHQHLEEGLEEKWQLGELQGIDSQGSGMLIGEKTDEYTTSPLSKQFAISRFDEKNNYNEKAMQNRVSQMQQTQNIKFSITIPGDISRNVGDVIELDLDSVQFGGQIEDNLYKGKYLVTSLRHLIKDDRHSIVMEVIKDSYFRSLPKGK